MIHEMRSNWGYETSSSKLRRGTWLSRQYDRVSICCFCLQLVAHKVDAEDTDEMKRKNRLKAQKVSFRGGGGGGEERSDGRMRA